MLMDDNLAIGLKEGFEELAEEAKEPYRIRDDAEANWAMRKIAQSRKDTAMWSEHFAAQLASIRDKNEQTEAFFTACLADYFGRVPVKKTKTQAKYSLPTGDLIRKEQGPKYETDSDTLASFLEENELAQFVKYKAEPMWGELKKQCIVQPDGSVVEVSTGMVLEGVTAQFRPEKFEIKLKEDHDK